nr:nucleoporin p58/p45 [Aotus nancymaae]
MYHYQEVFPDASLEGLSLNANFPRFLQHSVYPSALEPRIALLGEPHALRPRSRPPSSGCADSICGLNRRPGDPGGLVTSGRQDHSRAPHGHLGRSSGFPSGLRGFLRGGLTSGGLLECGERRPAFACLLHPLSLAFATTGADVPASFLVSPSSLFPLASFPLGLESSTYLATGVVGLSLAAVPGPGAACWFSEGSLFQSTNTATSGLGQNALGLTLGTTAATSTAGNEGLGGIDFSSSSDKKSDKTGTRPEDSKALKDENLPPVICQDVENLQKFVKEQKQVQEEISRMSSKAMLKVQEDIKALKQLLSLAANGLQRNTLNIDKLKIETAQVYYFRILVEQFEVQLQQYRQQIEELENHLATQANNSHITPQDLSMAMQKIYQTFVALAAQLQSIHENVKVLKEQYLGYRKMFLGDAVDVFEARRAEAKKWQNTPRVTTGPTPFSTMPNAAAVAMAATLTQQQQPATGPQPSLGVSFGTPFGSGIGTGLQSSGLGSSNLGGFGTSSGFGCSTTGASTFGFGTTNKPSGSLSAGNKSEVLTGFRKPSVTETNEVGRKLQF